MSKVDILLVSEDNWILEQGDDLEIMFKDNLRQHIPYYEKLWGIFIGNDTQNQIVDLQKLPEENIPIRKRFSECHYTIAESILCMEQCITDLEEIDGKLDGVNTLRFQTFFIAFFSHIGRAYDNISKCTWDIGLITGKIKGEGMEIKEEFDKHGYLTRHMSSLNKFYTQRHVVVHGKKVPLGTTEDGKILMPRIREDKQEPTGWYYTLSWSDFTDPVDLLGQLKKVYQEYCAEVNNTIASLYNDLAGYLKEINASIKTPKQVYEQIESNPKKNPTPKGFDNIPGEAFPYSGSQGTSPLSEFEKQIPKGGTSGWHGSSGSAGK